MKRFFKILAIFVGLIFVVAIIASFVLASKIDDIIKTEGNKLLNAKFDYSSLDISFIKNFPHISVTLKDLQIDGTGNFENESLIKAEEITAAVNIMSLFQDTGYEISKIFLENIYVNAVKLPDGQVNWDILKSSPEEEQPAEEAPKPSTEAPAAAPESKPLKIILKDITLNNINLSYNDQMAGISADIKELGASISGNFATDKTDLLLETAIKTITVKMQDTAFLKDAAFSAKLNVDADLANMKFTVMESNINLNNIRASIDGWAALLDEAVDMDLALSTNNISFKELLSLVPAGYIKELEKVKTDGSVSLKVSAKGKLQGENLPSFKADLNVQNASFHYPDLPTSVDNINIRASAASNGGPLDNIHASVAPLSFEIENNPFTVNASVKTPISDPNFTAEAKGIINLKKIKDIYPIDNISLSGILEADVKASGKLSFIEKQQYEKFNIKGTVKLNDADITLQDLPNIKIKKSVFSFTPKILTLNADNINLGQNDISVQSSLENYIAYVLKGDTIKGTLKVNSNYFNVNDFITAEEQTDGEKPAAGSTGEKTASEKPPVQDTPKAATENTSSITAIEIPKNIDFNMNLNMKKVLFADFVLENVNGILKVKNGEVDMENVSFNILGGFIGLNGLYSTKDNPKNPKADVSLTVKDMSFTNVYNNLNVVREMAPILSNVKGDFSGKLSLDTVFDEKMSPILETINGSGSLNAKDISLSNVKAIDRIADILKKNELKNIKTKDINMSFAIKNGRMTIAPFNIKAGNTVINLSGSSGLDQTLDFSGKISLPDNKAKLNHLDLKITGTFTDPKVSIDTKGMIKQGVEAAKDKLAEELKKQHDINLKNAQKEKEKLINDARIAADKLIKEAEKQAEALKQKAGNNPLQKFAIEKTAEQLIKEARNQADKIINEASKKGDEIINKAKSGQ